MSWFSREWDGVHMEGCPLHKEDLDIVNDCPCNHTHYFRDGESVNIEEVLEDECRCPDLMVEQAISAGDTYRDRIQEGM